MITWLQLWPLLALPTLILGAITAIPTKLINGHVMGGGPVREYLLNHVLVPVLPNDAAVSVVQWFAHANAFQEWFLSLLVIVNINGLLLPLLFVFGQGLIALSTWFTRKNIQLKRDAIRK
jgi:hypothetical protein